MAEEFNIPKSNFQEWYPELLRQADIVDDRYPIKGCLVWKGWGYGILRGIMNIVREEVEAKGHEEVKFPLMIPEDVFATESAHIKGFESEVFWVTHAGLNRLERKLLLRPTSETAMYPMFSLWIRSHHDLPLRIYQIVNVFRYETKHTRPIIRVREVSSFYESHTAHKSWEDAEKQVEDDIEVMRNIGKRLCIDFYLLKRPEWDKFPGAIYSIGADTLFPDLKTLQIGTIHNLGENFSKPFEIKFLDENGDEKYVNQTCYGMSERLVAAVIAIHGDDRGLCLPPEIAPKQVVIVPIYTKKNRETVLKACENVEKTLKSAGIRVFIDRREIRPGAKYYDWELKGVPVRIEIGPRDIENKSVILVRRDNKNKTTVPIDDVVANVKAAFDKIADNLHEKAKKMKEENTHLAETVDGAYKILSEKKGFVTIYWCGSEKCAGEIEVITGADFLGHNVEIDSKNGRCVICGKEESPIVYLSKKY